jgi:hypothetical protein
MMTATKQLEQTRELSSFMYNTTRDKELTAAPCMAFGVKLVNLMWANRSLEFIHQTKPYGDHALMIFKTAPNNNMPDIMVLKFISDMRARAKIFEEQRQSKQANFLRCITSICDVRQAWPNRVSMSLSLSKAATKAWYAGADIDQIKSAAMLLF